MIAAKTATAVSKRRRTLEEPQDLRVCGDATCTPITQSDSSWELQAAMVLDTLEPHTCPEPVPTSGQQLQESAMEADTAADTAAEVPHVDPFINISTAKDFLLSKRMVLCSPEASRPSLPLTEQLEKEPWDDMAVDDERLSLAHWVPDACAGHVLGHYCSRGITRIFPWQVACLETPGVLSGDNLVYSAPTSAGKTMVAELLMLRRLFNSRKKGIIVFPFVSVAQEKANLLTNMLEGIGLSVGAFVGSQTGNMTDTDLAVCTIEKANSLINRLLEENSLDSLSIVVIDELHMISDSSRGYLLELMLNKLRCQQPDVQIIGLSATLPNIQVLSEWLDAKLFITKFRPVPLQESVAMLASNSPVVDILDHNLKVYSKLDLGHLGRAPTVLDVINHLVREPFSLAHSVLIFNPTKKGCEDLAKKLTAWLKKFVSMLKVPLATEELQAIKHELFTCPAGLDSTLKQTLDYGIAFHHGGLTMNERDIIEQAYRQGHIRVLCATTTLSSGVNLPARRVIVRSVRFCGRIDTLSYRQMIGRAGRLGQHELGESFLVCSSSQRSDVKTLLHGSTLLKSSLISAGEANSGIQRAVLEAIVGRLASTENDLHDYLGKTLLAHEVRAELKQSHNMDSLVAEATCYLRDNNFIIATDGDVRATKLGYATVASALPPPEALHVFADLEVARSKMVLDSELHLVYLATPIFQLGKEPSWSQLLTIFNQHLDSQEQAVAALVGVNEGFLTRAMRLSLTSSTTDQRDRIIHHRFYVALILCDLIHEYSFSKLRRKYDIPRGALQNLQNSAATFAGMVTIFCSRLGWPNLELLMSQFQDRLSFGVERQLCDLVKLPSMTGARARVLYNGGFTDLPSIALAKSADIASCLRKASPFARPENHLAFSAMLEKEANLATALIGEASEYLVYQAQSRLQPPPVEVNPSVDASALPLTQAMTQMWQTPGSEATQVSQWTQSGNSSGSLSLPFQLLVVTSHERILRGFCQEWLSVEEFAFQPQQEGDIIIGIAVAWSPETAFYFSLEAVKTNSQLKSAVTTMMAHKSVSKIGFNMKSLMKTLHCAGIEVAGKLFDPAVAAWLLEPECPQQTLESRANFDLTKLDSCCRTCAGAVQALLLAKEQLPKLVDSQLLSPMMNTEMPLVPVLAFIEREGIAYDDIASRECVELVKKRLLALETRAYELSGEVFSLVNPAEVSRILFQKLKLKYPGKSKDKEPAKYSTKKEVLLQLIQAPDDLPSVILEFRKLNRIISGIMGELIRFNKDLGAEGRRIYFSCNTHTATGRIATVDPNLQCLPKALMVVSHEDNSSVTITPRNAIAAAPGCKLIGVDYSQIEMRMLAHMSRDATLLTLFNTGGDVFNQMACAWLKLEQGKVTDEQRQATKGICYGLVYGMGPKTLAKQLGWEQSRATAEIARFKRTFAGVSKFIKEVQNLAKQSGCIRTLFGRIRRIQGFNSSRRGRSSHAQRVSINSMIQGSAADLMKLAMIDVHTKLIERYEGRCRIVLQIHDELLIEAPVGLVDTVVEVSTTLLENVLKLTVPLVVKVKIGSSWGELCDRTKSDDDDLSSWDPNASS